MGLKKKSAVETLLIILWGSLVLGFALTAVTLLPVNGNHQSQALSTSRGSKGLRSTLSDDESISFGYDEDFMGQDERVEIETSVRDLAMELESVPDDHKVPSEMGKGNRSALVIRGSWVLYKRVV